MARQRNKNLKVYSAVSDERLAVILARDYDRAPSEFVDSKAPGISDSESFLRNTSARGIEPMKKWL